MVSNFITRASFFPFVHSPTAANLDSVSVGLAMISASFLGYYKQQWLSTVPCVDSKLQISDNCKVLYTYLQSLFSSPRWSDSSANHNESWGISGAKPKAPSPEALIFLTYLSCAVLGENKAVHMSHGHHIKNRAPGVAQRTRDQCSEVMSQEIQVILRRGSVSLERHRKLQETHQKTTLPSVAESKQWGLPQLLRHMLPYNTVHFSGTIPIWSRTITAHADWCDMPLTKCPQDLFSFMDKCSTSQVTVLAFWHR